MHFEVGSVKTSVNNPPGVESFNTLRADKQGVYKYTSLPIECYVTHNIDKY